MNDSMLSMSYSISYIDNGTPKCPGEVVETEEGIRNIYTSLREDPNVSEIDIRQAYEPLYNDSSVRGSFVDVTRDLEEWYQNKG